MVYDYVLIDENEDDMTMYVQIMIILTETSENEDLFDILLEIS